MRRLLAIATLLVTLVAGALHAQDTTSDDKGFLTSFLEDNLSGAGRVVRIDGFAGALSSRATFATMTIADDQGVWLTIRNGALGWNRSALLSGNVEISEMSAETIVIDRRPVLGVGGAGYAAGSGFSLPDLPVSIDLRKIVASRVALGASILGEPVEFTLDGALSLAGGAGAADLSVVRTDGHDGKIALKTSFSNATQVLTLDLLAKEGKDGLAANLLGVPGRPALQLAASGTGPVSDLTLDMAMAADNQNRISGKVTLASMAPKDGTATGHRFALDLAGNVAPLFLPAYQGFFGDSVRLSASGGRTADGAISLDQLLISSSELTLTGAAALGAGYAPERAALTLQLGRDGISDVVLPIPGAPTSVQQAILNLGYDRAVGPDWSVGGKVSGLKRQGMTIATIALNSSGRYVAPAPGVGGTLDGMLATVASGIALDDAALAAAIGPMLTGKADLHWQEGAAFAVQNIAVKGEAYAATGNLGFSGVDGGVAIAGRITANYRDLSKLSGLAGRRIDGAGQVTLDGTYAPLTGGFDATASIGGTDVALGLGPFDRLLAGTSQIALSALRDTSGITLRSLDMASAGIRLKAKGHISGSDARLDADASLPDLSILGAGVHGAVTAKAQVSGTPDSLDLMAGGQADNLAIGNPSADRLLAGTSRLKLSGGYSAADGVRIGSFDLQNRVISLLVKGQGKGLMQPLQVDGKLSDVGLLTADVSGPLGLRGTVIPTPDGYSVDLAATGPGATAATVRGKLDSRFSRFDLAVIGSVQSAVANPFLGPATIGGPAQFDLTLKGPPTLASLAGTVTLRSAQVSVPLYGVSLNGVAADAKLAAGHADVTANAAVAGGGTVSASGSVGLGAPRNASLAVTMNAAHLRDPQLFDTSVSGRLDVTGPLGGGSRIAGQLSLGDTEIRLAATSFAGSLFTSAIDHVKDTAPVRKTRQRAGFGGAAGTGRQAATGAPIALDVTVAATRRIFVRGRGLDAELGGQVRLLGTTADVRPSGQFDLIRGRLDLLGKRFEITEGQVLLQGALVPTLNFVASTTADGTTSSIVIGGPASEPAISFTSSPALPEEEVVARLLFGRSLSSLSPFQAAQLASAIATLTGRGGEGLVGNLRKSFGLDDFDVATAADGTLAVRAGKYISDKLYTDVTVAQDGTSVIRLNLDISKSVTARSHVSTDGTTGIGIYYDRDY